MALTPNRPIRETTILFVLVTLAVGPALLTARAGGGTLRGTVADTSGGVLPGVGIAVHSQETGQERHLTTNERGFYAATFLPIGKYRVEASISGFGSFVRENVEIALNNTTVANFSLDPKVSAQVRVTAEQPHIDSTDQEIKGSLNEKQIMDKPTLAVGSFLSLAEAFAGFNENPTLGQNNPTASSGSSINFNGTGTRGATFQINGVNNDDSSENQNRQGAALSTIQESQVLKSAYSAEFGRGDGAVVLVQTKSGTNRTHGDVYLYQQDGDWNAKSFFAQAAPKPIRQRSEYGFTLGGPLARNRLFAFGNVDRTKSDGQNNYTRDLILASDATGPWLTRGNDTPENRKWIQSVLDRFPSSLKPNDSRSTRTFAGVAGFNFPDEDYSGRLDWNMSRGNTLTGRYQ